MNGNFHQSEESWEFQDGNRRVRMQSSQQSWSSHGQATMMAPLLPPSAPPAFPALQPLPSFDNMHQQMQTAAMTHHQSAMQHFNNVQQSMNSMFQPQQFLTPQQLPPAPFRRAIGPIVEEAGDSSEEESSEDSSDEDEVDNQLVSRQLQQQVQVTALEQRVAHGRRQDDAQWQAVERRYNADQQQLELQRQAMEQRFEANQQSIQQQGAIMHDRLKRLEEKDTKNQTEREAHDRELQKLRDENNRLSQQRYDDAEKHRREMADLAQMQASRPQQAPTVFDTSALEKVIREVQAQQLSRADIEKVIQDRVASQLDGLARQKDVEAAGSRMHKALSQLPNGASSDQVQQAVRDELGKAVDKLASKIQSNHPRIESGPAQPLAALPPPPIITQATSAAMHTAAESNAHPQLSDALVKTSAGKKKAEKAERHNPVEPSLQITNSADLPASAGLALTKVKKDKKSSKDTHASAQVTPLTQRALVPAAVIDSSSQVQALTKVSKKKKKSAEATNAASVPSQCQAPDTSNLGLALARVKKEKKSSKSASNMLTEVASALPVNAQALAAHLNKSVVQGASAPAELPNDFPDNASQISSWERTKAKLSKHAPEEQALVKKSKKGKTTLEPIAESITPIALVSGSPAGFGNVTVADIQTSVSNMPLPNMTTSLELPGDFPDNASQISTWERGRAQRQGALPGTPAVPQIQGAGASNELVRASKSKKHRG